MKTAAIGGVIVSIFGAGLVLGACDGVKAQPSAAQPPSAQPAAQPSAAQPAAEPLDWKMLEAPYLTDHLQLTSRDMFVKAGEAYFDPSTRWIIFQGVPVPAGGEKPSEFYGMYIAKLVKHADGGITGIEAPIHVSPPGAWNSCGWFHPRVPGAVMFSTTFVAPSTEQKNEFRVDQRTYTWRFPEEAELVAGQVPALFSDIVGKPARAKETKVERVFALPDYQAEASWSKNGRFVLYAGVRPARTNGRPDADLFIYDQQTGAHHAIVTEDGYDGGPFFSPDETMICYRSDRKGDDRLQIFVAELKYEDGVPVGVKAEHQLTDNGAVNWAPYWHPSGKYLVFGSSLVGHHNYEVWAVEAQLSAAPNEPRVQRVTQATATDVLPVFSPDGAWMMWTAQRGPLAAGEQKPSSQLWIARTAPGMSPGALFPAR
ncbi:MAG: TolB family protein [Phycisphaerales bacterium]